MDKLAGAFKVRVVGIVQGVGFRPFIYRLAKRLGLRGYVVNLGGSEVEIHVEGVDRVGLERFLEAMEREKPPRTVIERIMVIEVDSEGYMDFKILESKGEIASRSMIPPDISICDDCVKEILDPNNNGRFYGYHWNSCAWCGPRFSMMYRTPYDRENTSMGKFKLCSECAKSYSDPEDLRRFHGQGISCLKCGPKTHVYGMDGLRIEVEDPVEFAVKVILEGGFIALKGVGGFHIACLASRDDVVAELRRRKKRPQQPFALMARDWSVVLRLVDPPLEARGLLEGPRKPILVLPKKLGAPVSELVAPGLSTLGVMLPYTGFQTLLLNGIPEGFLIMTSGNRSGRPMCTSLGEALVELRGIVDYIVDHEREIVHRVDDSVLRFTDGRPVFLRRGRGYAPEWVEVGFRIVEAAAVGGELQSVGGVGFEDKIVLTQFIGDVDEPAQLWSLERELKWLIEVYGLKPRIIALDMHPQYSNRLVAERLGETYGARLIEVQHHHAHAATVIGELKAESSERFMAITIDGTGYGEGGEIWGGEILLASLESYKRVGSIKPFTLPGGDTAAKHPAKTLVSLLASNGYSEEETIEILYRHGVIDGFPHGIIEAKLTHRLAASKRGFKTSSLGRILDAFSTLLGACKERTYEGEPAIKLEALADNVNQPPIDQEPRITMGENRLLIDVKPLLEWTLENLNTIEKGRIALTIQYNLGKTLAKTVLEALKGRRNIRREVIVSGGAAVNTHIIKGIKSVLRKEGLEVILPSKTPPGDGGIALGQILVASSVNFKSQI
ncbi:MAG: carbamoyltransferase HypF [Candidatus Methanomethylicia archaeon]